MRVGGGAVWAGALAATAALAGCGSGSSGTNADPAKIVPASAPLYVSVAVKPKGGANGGGATAARKLTHLSEPYARLAEGLLSGEGDKPRFKQEIEPWAGERAGIFLTAVHVSGQTSGVSAQGLAEGTLANALSAVGAGAFGDGRNQGAVVFDTADASRAKSFLDGWANRRRARRVDYRGVGLRVSASGTAAGIVKRFLVIGSESGCRSAIDASLGAPALGAASDYSKPPAGAIATVQLAPERLAQATGGEGSNQPAAALRSLFAGAESASLAVTGTPGSLSLEGRARYRSSTAAGSSPFGSGGAQALAALPGGSWLAAGVGDVSANAGTAVDLLRSVSALGLGSAFSSIGGAGIERLLDRLGSEKARLASIFSGWAGPAGVFVSGTGLFDLQAALTISSSDPAASRAAVAALAGALRRAGAVVAATSIPGTDAAATVKLTGFPAVLFIADGQNKFVLGLGRASVEGALRPSSTLSSSPSYQAATQALGGGLDPSLIAEFPALLGFLEGVGFTQSPPLSSVVPYLKSLGTLTAGAATSGPTIRFRAVLGLA